MNNPITVIESNGMRFPVFYNGLFEGYWTPKFARYYDTIEELQKFVEEFTANVVIL